MTELPEPLQWDEELLNVPPEEAAALMLQRVRSRLLEAQHPKTDFLSEEDISCMPRQERDVVNMARHRRALRKSKRLRWRNRGIPSNKGV